MWVQPLSWEDLLEEEMAIHSSILAWKIPGQKSLVGYSPQGRKESDMTVVTQHAHRVDIKVHWIYSIIEYHFKFSWSAAISFEFNETIDVYIQIVKDEHRAYSLIDYLRIKLCHLIIILVVPFYVFI